MTDVALTVALVIVGGVLAAWALGIAMSKVVGEDD